MPPLITSTKNKQVAAAARLKKRVFRERDQRFLAEGAQATREAVEAGAAEVVFHATEPGGEAHPDVSLAEAAGVPTLAVSEAVMGHLTSTVTPQGIVTVARFIDVALESLPREPALVPVLCAVRDPGNAGTVLRSADAAGADSIVFSDQSVDVYNSKTVRASAGSLFHLPVVRGASVAGAVAALRDRGLQVLAADAQGEASVYETDLSRPTAVLFGNEAWGLSEEALALADLTVRVPIRGKAESLNLAAAAALLLFESARQQGAGGSLEAPRRGGGSLAATLAAGAHDVRSPLTTLKGFASTLAERWDQMDDRVRADLLGGLSVDAERTTAAVKMLVDLSRIETGTFRPSASILEVEEEARSVARALGRSPDLPEVRVSGAARGRIDPDRFGAMLMALCESTAWWGGEGPIEVWLEERDGVVVEVSRKGDGPGPEQASVLADDPATGRGKVLPYLVRRLAEALGGSLVCEGNEGIRFRLTLPGT
ncbi:MAG TPA: TrmH family RNA methyltransferase [Actinomycetota bacterium]|nr:TrmH family RNA methyltransferase [Actinomycetota bacterium]